VYVFDKLHALSYYLLKQVR